MNPPSCSELDDLMERASESLTAMDYLASEALCLDALAQARRAGDWPYYARILMPLQESRRQRRMIAAEGYIRLGTNSLAGPASAWLNDIEAACIVVTKPHTATDAWDLADHARSGQRHAVVLFADNAPAEPRWVLRSFRGPDVSCAVDAPPAEWHDQWIAATDAAPSTAARNSGSPADWFLDAAEALGDAALERVDAPPGEKARIEALESMLAVVTDHEILHQRLGDAARVMRPTGR